MLNKMVLTGLGLLYFTTAIAADDIVPDELPLQWESIITLSGGMGWANAGQNQYLYPFPPPYYQYFTYSSDTSSMASGELFFGLQRPVSSTTLAELGLGIAGMTDATVAGFVDVNGAVDAYAYSYQVNHSRVQLKGRLIAYTMQPLQPYISASLGVAFNNAHNYRPVLLNPNLPYPLQFVSNTTVAFPYTVGVGMQTILSPHWLLALGYQFSDLGKSYLNGDGQYLTKGLRLTHFYTNEALMSISYTFS